MSADKKEQAARVGDPVEHNVSTLGKMAGFAVGALVGVAVVLTAPVSLTAIGVAGAVGTVAGGAALGGTAGEVLTATFAGRYDAGDVETGADTVYVGGTASGVPHKAARVHDLVGCHDEPIATGLLHIFIEGQNATRATEETRCAGKLKKDACCPTVYYCGPSARFIPTRYHGEEPAWFYWADLSASLLSGRGALLQAHRWYRIASAADTAYSWYRGGPIRKWLSRANAVAAVLGEERFIERSRRAAYDLSPERVARHIWLGEPEPAPTPYVDEMEGES